MGKLIDTRVRALKPGDRDQWLGDGGGLWLRVRTSGTKTWCLRTRRGGSPRVITLGAYPQLSLSQARIEAQKRRGRRTPHNNVLTVRELAEEWYAAVVENKQRQPHQVRGYLDNGLIPDLGHLRVFDVTRADLSESVKGYRRRGAVTANRYLGYVKQVFSFAAESGYLDDDPAAALTRRIAGGQESARERVLTDDEIRRLWWAKGSPVPLLRFLLLTLARISEAQVAQRWQIDGSRWIIPPHHTKNRKAHWVHLPALALEVIGNHHEPEDPLFTQCTPTNVQAWLRRWCEREEIDPAFTPHDLRRTGATRMGDIGIPPHVIEKCLNHTMQGVMAVYNRGDYEAERIDAAERWAAKAQEIVSAG